MFVSNSDMKRVLGGASIVATILICSAAVALAQFRYMPPEVTSATDAHYPNGTIFQGGVVVLDLSLDAEGHISASKVLRDIASLTPVATSSVQSWKFNPAFEKGTKRPSEMRVAFVFLEGLSGRRTFIPVIPDADSRPNERPTYIPPEIVSVAYPEYRLVAAGSGAVVLQVHVDDEGKIGYVEVIREMPRFTLLALNAAQKWQFQPATLNGKPIFSNVAIVFVFWPPLPG
jgi:TonB family protein